MFLNLLSQIRQAKTRRGKKALESREPKRFEDEKEICLIRGSNCNHQIVKLMKDIYVLKKPNSHFLGHKNNNFHPFEDQSNIEFLCKKNDSGLFMFGSHSKKRPNNLVVGRTFNHQVLDMVEFGVEELKLMEQFKTSKITMGIKPLILFAGQAFNEQDDYRRIQNLFIDLFSANTQTKLNLSNVEHVIQLTAIDEKILFRSYKIVYKKSGCATPRVELEEIGPHFDLRVRRSRFASKDLFKKACYQQFSRKPNKVKNMEKTSLGDTLGRIHMERQDYSKLSIRRLKGLDPKESYNKREAEEDLNNNMKKIKFNNEDFNESD